MKAQDVPFTAADSSLPGSRLSSAKMPGHWLLARLGKRVLRPGGREATLKLLHLLHVNRESDVVEFAPGLGLTARMALSHSPRSYTAIEKDAEAARRARHHGRTGSNFRCVIAAAQETGLPGRCASIVYGEAMLTMQAEDQKQRIVAEAYRLLRPRGLYGIHELALMPNEISDVIRKNIHRDLAETIRVNARPLTPDEWTSHLRGCGFEIQHQVIVPMRLLEAGRMLRDEGPLRFAKILFNAARDEEARERALRMRAIFRKYREFLAAVVIIGKK